jgi:hypothetical protein
MEQTKPIIGKPDMELKSQDNIFNNDTNILNFQTGNTEFKVTAFMISDPKKFCWRCQRYSG